MVDVLWTNARIATMREGGAPWGEVADGAIAVEGDRISCCDADGRIVQNGTFLI